jgi:hypothetical protein
MPKLKAITATAAKAINGIMIAWAARCVSIEYSFTHNPRMPGNVPGFEPECSRLRLVGTTHRRGQGRAGRE